MSNKTDFIEAGSVRSKNVDKLMAERAWCFFIPEQHGEEGFIPAVAIENVAGYHMLEGKGEGATPWFWGKTEAEAREVADTKNEAIGVSKERAQQIVLSTMGSFARDSMRAKAPRNY